MSIVSLLRLTLNPKYVSMRKMDRVGSPNERRRPSVTHRARTPILHLGYYSAGVPAATGVGVGATLLRSHPPARQTPSRPLCKHRVVSMDTLIPERRSGVFVRIIVVPHDPAELRATVTTQGLQNWFENLDSSAMQISRAASSSVLHFLFQQIRFGLTPAGEHTVQLSFSLQKESPVRSGTHKPV